METDALDYALTVILSIVNEDNEVYPVAFYSCTFTAVELNYDTHDKELLAIFKAFKIWQHYLEGLAYPIDIIIDHKNLKYFSTTYSSSTTEFIYHLLVISAHAFSSTIMITSLLNILVKTKHWN